MLKVEKIQMPRRKNLSQVSLAQNFKDRIDPKDESQQDCLKFLAFTTH